MNLIINIYTYSSLWTLVGFSLEATGLFPIMTGVVQAQHNLLDRKDTMRMLGRRTTLRTIYHTKTTLMRRPRPGRASPASSAEPRSPRRGLSHGTSRHTTAHSAVGSRAARQALPSTRTSGATRRTCMARHDSTAVTRAVPISWPGTAHREGRTSNAMYGISTRYRAPLQSS